MTVRALGLAVLSGASADDCPFSDVSVSQGYVALAYRMGIIKQLKTETAEQTLIALRSQELIQTEHRNFLRLFDETFLGLFPDFIEQVRNLLHDPERFMPKRSRQLSTELRYLALIRLGVSDSAQIAMFLNSTLSTIYTYRARLRNGRIDKTSDIEEQIRRICLS